MSHLSVSARPRHAALLPFLLIAVLLGSMIVSTVPADATTRARKVANAFQIARYQQGDPYRWGAAGPNAFDCSGLTYYAFRRAGISNIPRTSSSQARFARHIKRSNMRRGDLMFFHSGGRVYHVGLFAGWSNGRRVILHSPRTGERVKRERVWTNQWFAGTLR